MKAYMTNGTYEFLNKLKNKHTISPFLLMNNRENAIAFYESEKQSIFQTGRNYEVIAKEGNLSEEGFASIIHLPITDEGRPIFELEWKDKLKRVGQLNGLIAARVLRPLRGNEYLILTEWADNKVYQTQKDFFIEEEKSPYSSAGPNYTKTYHVGEKEED
ncbi:antibiotic biosynthesis monooxygenase [Gracilibacillus oryzae]|uniref:Antibiotic biosynthesis monooxygenase n=1 Tax=Gracilibacillus oryzae TaxID=1672701 RepID=A0A7C8GVC6_9BACI|nr:antibiotic biosynthesis monooxygenase [Gracilibacillus oryzae]KAB8139014.1 antibiotic biosynthesis monooxygenase [Gracilibacillus oryzae]